jgi:alpha-1,4-digalacturonate transport system permease protein
MMEKCRYFSDFLEATMRPADSAPQKQKKSKAPSSGLFGRILTSLFGGLANLIGFLVEPLQKFIGVQRMGYFFVLPNLLIFGIFVLFPMLLNFGYATTGGTNLYLQERPFVGTENFETLLDCENYLEPSTCNQDIFWRAAQNTVIFVIFQVSGMVILALITAVVLNRALLMRGFFRSIFFYPVLLSPVVVAFIWRWILRNEGLLDAIMLALGTEPAAWLLNTDWATFWVIMVTIWAQMGFYTLILLAGLQSIPGNLYEAAQIDGANPLQSFFYVTLPLLRPTLLVVTVLALIRAVQIFDEVFVLTGGGPGTATTYLVQYIYDTGFTSQVQRFGLASAASVMLGVTLLILTLIQLRTGGEESGAAVY